MNDTPTLAMLHTVPGLVTDMETLASDTVPGLRVLHYVDESLLQDTIAKGTMPGHVRRRLVNYARYAEESGAQALLVSCSSIGEAATAAQDFVSIPVLRIDTPMAELAVLSGDRIGVLATLAATLGPTTRLVQDSAKRQNKKPTITARKVDGAFYALRAGDLAMHDRLLLAAFSELAAECDVVVLAQASMARVIEHTLDQPGGPAVLASPGSGMTQLSTLFPSKDSYITSLPENDPTMSNTSTTASVGKKSMRKRSGGRPRWMILGARSWIGAFGPAAGLSVTTGLALVFFGRSKKSKVLAQMKADVPGRPTLRNLPVKDAGVQERRAGRRCQ